MADRRMLGRAVSQSRKVNSLSLKAALLWTWTIPWFDSYGYLEAEPDFIKFNILPRRHDISVEDLPGILQELSKSGLWRLYKSKEDGKIIAFDPKFKDFQNLREERLGKQKYTPGVLLDHSWTTPGVIPEENEKKLSTVDKSVTGENYNYSRTTPGVDGTTPPEDNISEVKLSITPPTPPKSEPVDNRKDVFLQKEPEDKKQQDPDVKKKIESFSKKFQAVENKLRSRYPRFNYFLFLQNHPGHNFDAILYAFNFLLNAEESIEYPDRYMDAILKKQNANFNEADYIHKANEQKRLFADLVEGLKRRQQMEKQENLFQHELRRKGQVRSND